MAKTKLPSSTKWIGTDGKPTQVFLRIIGSLVDGQTISASGTPEGIIAAGENVLYRDTDNNNLYIKTTTTGDTGWVLT